MPGNNRQLRQCCTLLASLVAACLNPQQQQRRHSQASSWGWLFSSGRGSSDEMKRVNVQPAAQHAAEATDAIQPTSLVLRALLSIQRACDTTHSAYTLPALALLCTLLIRQLVSLWPYSGYNDPPRYGDCEAQRHWLEVTYNLPVSDWYRPTADNDLQYWGLDYPPLTAYHSYALACIAHLLGFDPLIALYSSRGIETLETKLFMRWTVIVSELLVYSTGAYKLYRQLYGRSADASQSTTLSLYLLGITLAVIAPIPLLLIDHGHFQYNAVCLGLMYWTLYYLVQQDDPVTQTPNVRHQLLASVCFCCCLCFKQIALYYSPTVFFYLLAVNWRYATRSTQAPQQSTVRYDVFLTRIAYLGITVICTMALLFSPWLLHADRISAITTVIGRIFPFQRGIYEDKVANVWSCLSLVIKWHQWFSSQLMLRIAAAATLLSFMPSAYALVRRPTTHNLLLQLSITSLSFYLLSYQVHEKSILFPLTAMMLLLPTYPTLVLYTMLIASFSMYPLLYRDGLAIPYGVLQIVLLVVTYSVSGSAVDQQDGDSSVYSRALPLMRYALKLSTVSAVAIHALAILMPYILPVKLQQRFPDIVTYMFTCYSAVHFVAVWLLLSGILAEQSSTGRPPATTKQVKVQ